MEQERAVELIEYALHDLGIESKTVISDKGEAVPVIETVVPGCWLGSLMVSIDLTSLLITGKRLFDVVYRGDDACADGIGVVEQADIASTLGGTPTGYSQYETLSADAHGIALTYTLARGGTYSAFDIRANEILLRRFCPADVRHGEVIPMASPAEAALREFRNFAAANSPHLARAFQLETAVPSPKV